MGHVTSHFEFICIFNLYTNESFIIGTIIIYAMNITIFIIIIHITVIPFKCIVTFIITIILNHSALTVTECSLEASTMNCHQEFLIL